MTEAREKVFIEKTQKKNKYVIRLAILKQLPYLEKRAPCDRLFFWVFFGFWCIDSGLGFGLLSRLPRHQSHLSLIDSLFN